jgi:hypothetical protein
MMLQAKIVEDYRLAADVVSLHDAGHLSRLGVPQYALTRARDR